MEGRAEARPAGAGMIFTVAIDGPAAAGKGTISRAVAVRFGFRHLDTGLLYRAVGAMGGDPVAAAGRLTPADLARDDLRSLAAGQAASRVAAIPEVRAALVDFQRRFARGDGGAVLDGRDIGTVVCPDAAAKLFITASVEARAQRRFKELQARDGKAIYARVLQDMQERDARDQGRSISPTKAAADAMIIDTSDLTADQVFDQALAFVTSKMKA